MRTSSLSFTCAGLQGPASLSRAAHAARRPHTLLADSFLLVDCAGRPAAAASWIQHPCATPPRPVLSCAVHGPGGGVWGPTRMRAPLGCPIPVHALQHDAPLLLVRCECPPRAHVPLALLQANGYTHVRVRLCLRVLVCTRACVRAWAAGACSHCSSCFPRCNPYGHTRHVRRHTRTAPHTTGTLMPLVRSRSA